MTGCVNAIAIRVISLNVVFFSGGVGAGHGAWNDPRARYRVTH